MQGKKWIAAALVCGFLLGQGTAPAQAGILGTVVKGADGYGAEKCGVRRENYV